MALKFTGIIKRIDEVGRITLPKELRGVMNIEHKDPMEIYVKDGFIYVEKHAPESFGIVRKLDELGRITLPSELRESMDIKYKDPFEIYVDDGSVAMRKYEPGCVFCQSATDNILYQDKKVCRACLEKLKQL